MFSKLAKVAVPLIAALGVQEAQAGWGFFWCEAVPSLQTVDFTAFSGTWFEIYRDSSHDYWSNEKCSTAFYDLITTSSSATARLKQIMLTRSSKAQFWGGEGTALVDSGYITFPLGDGAGQENYSSLLRQGTHQILETDYVNYAVVYGCQNWLGGVLGHFDWATFLSRTTFADARGVQLAKTKLTSVGYDWSYYWMKPGIECGMDAAPTNDELFIAMIETKPDFLDFLYNDKGTMYARYLFETSDHFPIGYLTGPLTFGKQSIKTGFKSLVTSSAFQSYYSIGPIKYSSTSTYSYQIQMLSVGLSSTALAALEKVEKTPASYYWQDYETYLTGFARVIQYTTSDKKIVAFREGEFANGSQSNFGRFVDSVTKSVMIQYTGWWPTYKDAKGISVISDSFTTFQGDFKKNSAFPSSGMDDLSYAMDITSLEKA